MNKPGKKDKYLIIEGLTEKLFLQQFQSYMEPNFNLYIIDAQGKDNIVYEYRKIKKKNPSSDVVILFDLDARDSLKTMEALFKKNGLKISKKEMFFVNPSFEIILILIKKNETPIDRFPYYMKKIYGIENYEKTKKQLKQIMKQISKSEFESISGKIKRYLGKDDKILRSSNYDLLFEDLFSKK